MENTKYPSNEVFTNIIVEELKESFKQEFLDLNDNLEVKIDLEILNLFIKWIDSDPDRIRIVDELNIKNKDYFKPIEDSYARLSGRWNSRLVKNIELTKKSIDNMFKWFRDWNNELYEIIKKYAKLMENASNDEKIVLEHKLDKELENYQGNSDKFFEDMKDLTVSHINKIDKINLENDTNLNWLDDFTRNDELIKNQLRSITDDFLIKEIGKLNHIRVEKYKIFYQQIINLGNN